jgi:hypothetical protein
MLLLWLCSTVADETDVNGKRKGEQDFIKSQLEGFLGKRTDVRFSGNSVIVTALSVRGGGGGVPA